ncbi:hypothetical protein MPC4_350029 [Methylocella tundrae]|uniref:Uncharacterized protein n=1 Tax=Methylocella tundrae TaxID=227605 RepID=A0A8B6M8G8_METTU|nr:hypothetical protein [Methylocella tundrae]VTZ51323.1 hypothetical protein MPC4_350029 [Methylocella tundrae]
MGQAIKLPRHVWRMPPLEQHAPTNLSRASRIWMAVLQGCLVLAGGLVLIRIVALTIGHG